MRACAVDYFLTRRGAGKSKNIMASYAQGDEQCDGNSVSCFHSTMFASAARCQYAISAPLLKVTKKQMDGLSTKVSDLVVLATSNGENSTANSRRYVFIITLIWSILYIVHSR